MNVAPAANVAKNNSKFLNSLIHVKSFNAGMNAIKNTFSGTNANTGAVNTGGRGTMIGILVFVVLVAVLLGVMIYFKEAVQEAWKTASDAIANAMGLSTSSQPPAPAPKEPTPLTQASPQTGEPGRAQNEQDLVEKVLPGGAKEVFNVSSNKFTFYDAEPLCKALGAELATYDQVKEAWNKGADWCNYGWVKGQMAVYPTSDETYAKLQAGPEEQRMACGRPGINGGYFDNPELRFGVTCVGQKPVQSKHDEREVAKGAPLSPEALAFDKKVNQYKTQSDTIGILPFNTNKWSG